MGALIKGVLFVVTWPVVKTLKAVLDLYDPSDIDSDNLTPRTHVSP